MSSIAEPPKNSTVDWTTLGQLAGEAAVPNLSAAAFLDIWKRAKVASGNYQAAAETIRMLAPASVNPADL
jgi:hypothetical protein